MILNVHILVLFGLHVYIIPSPFLLECGRGSLFQLPRDVQLIKRNKNGCYFMGVGHKKSGTPDCGRELPGGCPFLAILAKVKGKSFAVSALY